MARRSIQGCRGILTGASSGIGRALAAELVRGGAQILVVARREERLAQLADSLKGTRGRVEIFAGDVTVADSRRQIIERARRAFGGLDLLVNNAGIGALGRFAEASAERLRQVMEVNFFAPAELTRLALPALRQGRRPMVVNVGSIVGHRGLPFYTEYCASKFALRGLSEALRAELTASGIELLLVSPGPTESEFFEHAITDQPVSWPRSRAVSAETVARRTVSAIRAGRHEIVVGLPGKLLVWANRLFPWALDRVLARYG
jgi:short-subunit dehydrogenase